MSKYGPFLSNTCHSFAKSSLGGYKVSIIWLPERMNVECANKLLKLLEEPPHQTIFIMVSEAPERLLETVRSRTQMIQVKRIDTAVLERALVEKRGLDGDTARRVAQIANGSWLDAIRMLNADSEAKHSLTTSWALCVLRIDVTFVR